MGLFCADRQPFRAGAAPRFCRTLGIFLSTGRTPPTGRSWPLVRSPSSRLMPPISTLTAPSSTARTASAPRDVRAVRFAHYGAPGEPPSVSDIAGDDASVIEDLYVRTADACVLPPLAVREIIENLVHADFEGACVSVFDGGASLRVSDCGPGIADKDRAVLPGFSTACERVRSKQIERNNGETNVKDLFPQRQANLFAGSHFCDRVMLSVNQLVKERYLVHQNVTKEKEEIVEQQTARDITHDFERRGRTKGSESPVAARRQNVPGHER